MPIRFTSNKREIAYGNIRVLRDSGDITRTEFAKRAKRIINAEMKAREKMKADEKIRREIENAQRQRSNYLESIKLTPAGRTRLAFGSSINSNQYALKDPIVVSGDTEARKKVVGEIKKQLQRITTNNKILVKVLVNTNDGYAYRTIGKADANINIISDIIDDKLEEWSEKMYASDVALEVFGIDIVEMRVQGGCDENTHHRKINDIKVMSPKSTNQNCLFACIHHFLKQRILADNTRKQLNILPNTPISVSQLDTIAKHYKITIHLYDIDGVFNDKYNDGFAVCNIMLWANNNGMGHYVLMEGEVKQCDECGKSWIKKHSCNLRRRMWLSRMSGKRIVIPSKALQEEAFNPSDMLYYDLETFKPGDTDAITPYAASWYCDDKYYTSYGENAWNEFIDFLMLQNNKIVCAYNGAGFDFHFLMNEMIMRGIEVKDSIVNNGRIMSFSFGKNRCWDLCLFTLSSLKDACKDFKVSDDNTKTEFDHFKIKSWADVHKYREEVEPYVKRDVMGMKEVFEKFNDMVYQIFKVHMTDFVTLSAMSYAIWTMGVNDILELPDTAKYQFIRGSLYGGRTYPMVKEFTSKQYYDIIDAQDNSDKLKEIYTTMNDWIFNADARSLYPTAMIAYKYPTGHSSWIDPDTIDVEKLPMGIFEVDVVCNKDLIVPILPSKSNSGINWDMFDKHGIYTSADLENAQRCGYKITKVYKALVWKTSEFIFQDYITKCYKIKEENEDNPVLRQVGKILMNALYGKMLERARFEESKLCNHIADVSMFLRDFDATDIQFIKDKVVMIGVPKNEEISDDRVKKPSQVGTFILSYSRRHMLDAMMAIKPELDTHFFTYTDTDSLHIHCSTLPGLKEKGWLDSGLGKLSDDAKGGKIFREVNLAPKLYMYLCLMPDGKIKTCMKSKGIPKQYLSPHLFESADDLDDDEKLIVMTNRLKKVGYGRNMQIDYRKYDAFSILSIDMERTFYKNQWGGMDYKEGKWYPKK